MQTPAPSLGTSIRRAAAGVAERIGPRPAIKELGAAGKGMRGWGGSGRPTTETHYRLMGATAWADQVQSVLWDPKLRAAWGLRLSRMLGADFLAQASEPGEGPSEIAAYLNEAFGWEGRPGRMLRPFKVQAAERMQAYLAGWSLAADVVRVEDNVVWLDEWAPRHIGNLVGWGFDEYGRAKSVELRDPTKGSNYRLDLDSPRRGCFHLPFSFQGDPEGRDAALARPIFSWLEMKQHAAKQVWTGLGRWANPIPVAMVRYLHALKERIPQNFIAKASADTFEMLKRFYSGDQSAMVASDLVGVEAFGGDLDVSGPHTIMNFIDHQALAVFDAGFLVMGIATGFGSRSASEVHGSLGVVAAGNMLDHFCGHMREQTVRRMVRWQFGAKAPVPLIKHKGLDTDGLGNILGTIAHLVAAQVLTADPGLEDYIRRTYGMPALKEMRDAAARLKSDDSVGNPGEPGPGRGHTAGAEVIDFKAFAAKLAAEMKPALISALKEAA